MVNFEHNRYPLVFSLYLPVFVSLLLTSTSKFLFSYVFILICLTSFDSFQANVPFPYLLKTRENLICVMWVWDSSLNSSLLDRAICRSSEIFLFLKFREKNFMEFPQRNVKEYLLRDLSLDKGS